MDNLKQGIPGTFVIIDDILIACKTVEEHDQVLKQVIERATQYNLKLNYTVKNKFSTYFMFLACLSHTPLSKYN